MVHSHYKIEVVSNLNVIFYILFVIEPLKVFLDLLFLFWIQLLDIGFNLLRNIYIFDVG